MSSSKTHSMLDRVPSVWRRRTRRAFRHRRRNAEAGVKTLPVARRVVLVGNKISPGIRISMDGRGRWMDNVFIERLWRSLKYECVYIHAFEIGSELRAGLVKWIGFYNAARPHGALDGRTPDDAYYENATPASPGQAQAQAQATLDTKLAA
jgi:Integrase core domain